MNGNGQARAYAQGLCARMWSLKRRLILPVYRMRWCRVRLRGSGALLAGCTSHLPTAGGIRTFVSESLSRRTEERSSGRDGWLCCMSWSASLLEAEPQCSADGFSCGRVAELSLACLPCACLDRRWGEGALSCSRYPSVSKRSLSGRQWSARSVREVRKGSKLVTPRIAARRRTRAREGCSSSGAAPPGSAFVCAAASSQLAGARPPRVMPTSLMPASSRGSLAK
mmetsp:Transcript_3201/g.7906  ORF Transcript_3201/g.7906 Transcript_3201/m.7906 type:complete len:225 (-) Transcript_3201:403-1077(-)